MNERTKRAILTQEGVRRLINTSLEYGKEVRDEILSNYMQKLFNSGYDQKFRTEILLSVFKAFRNIIKKHESGEKPLHRDREFEKEERRRTKNNKVKSWYRKNNQYDSVMFVPLTPGSVLKSRIQDRIQAGQLRIKLVEFSGPKIVDIVKQKVKSGQGEERCGQDDCLVCNGEKAGKCRKRGIVYRIWCRKCASEGVRSVYIGESGNCSYERGRQHWQDYLSTNVETRNKSVLRRHVESVHNGNEEGVEFEMVVTDIFKNDPMGRQIMEGVKMREMIVDHIMNSAIEFHQPGEIIPTLEGAGRRCHNSQNNNSQKNNNSRNSPSDDNENLNENHNVVIDNSQSGRAKKKKKVTNGGRSTNSEQSVEGVTTRARARRENLIVV